MILERLLLENVGVYSGKHSIELASMDPLRPVTLIGAMNGAGKTTLLEALQLALFGRRAAHVERGGKAYRELLQEMIHWGADPAEGARIELHFQRREAGEIRRFVVNRSWRMNGQGFQERLRVSRDGVEDSLLTEHWDESVEAYFPARLANLFFFDGEQIKELADPDHAAEVLRTGIQSLLGLDLVTRLEADLAILERRKRGKQANAEDRRQLERAEAEMEHLRRGLETAKQEEGALRNRKEEREKRLAGCRDRFKAEGGELLLSRDVLEKEQRVAETQLEASETRLRELVEGPLPLVLVMDRLEEVEKQAEMELEMRRNRLVAEFEGGRDRRILADLKRTIADSEVLKIVGKALERHRTEATSPKADLFLDPPEEFPEKLRVLRTVILPRTREEALHLCGEAETLREKIARSEVQLAAVPDADALAKIQREMAALEAEIRGLAADLALAEDKLKRMVQQEEAAKAALGRLMEGALDIRDELEEERRIMVHIPKVRKTLNEFRQRLLERRLGRIEELVLECFHQLLHKRNLVERVRIHPETFHPELLGPKGRTVPFARLSAGERQILATSLLWGLARASGRPMPVVIDTPLGRLDSSHRRHLVERYFPSASHQVILLSTDEEIDARYFKLLQPSIGRCLVLEYDQATRSTTGVHSGYFNQ